MALKTWAPYDRLIAEDLNGAMGYLAGSGLMVPGVACKVPGPAIPTHAVNTNVALALGAPAAGTDPMGFYQSATGRAKVPPGAAGLYLIQVTITSMALVGVASNAGQYAQAWFQNTYAVGAAEAIGSFVRYDAITGIVGTILRPLADGDEWWPSITARVGDGKASTVTGWWMARLAQGVGAIGS